MTQDEYDIEGNTFSVPDTIYVIGTAYLYNGGAYTVAQDTNSPPTKIGIYNLYAGAWVYESPKTPAFAAAIDGGVSYKNMLYWVESYLEGGVNKVRFMRFDAVTETASEITGLATEHTYGFKGVAVDRANGLIYWGYTLSTDTKLYIRKYTVATTTDAAYTDGPETIDISAIGSMGVDSLGNVHVTYLNLAGTNYYWQYYDGGWNSNGAVASTNETTGYGGFLFDAGNDSIINADKSKTWDLSGDVTNMLNACAIFDKEGYPYKAYIFDVAAGPIYLFKIFELAADQTATLKYTFTADGADAILIYGSQRTGVIEILSDTNVLVFGGLAGRYGQLNSFQRSLF